MGAALIKPLAIVESERAQRALQHGIPEGTPELVIEVVSTFDSAEKMNTYRRLCLADRTLAFWAVYPGGEIQVYSKDQRTAPIYEIGDSVPISLQGVEAVIPLRDVFAGITLR